MMIVLASHAMKMEKIVKEEQIVMILILIRIQGQRKFAVMV